MMRLKSVLPVAIALALSAPSFAADANAAAQMVEKAGKLVLEKKPAEALAMLGGVIASFDGQLAEASSKGGVYCATSSEESLFYLLEATGKKRSSVVLSASLCDALFLQAYVLTELKRTPEAVTALERLTALAPINAHYFVELGYAYRVTGDPDKAMKSYRQAVEASQLRGEANADGKRDRAAALRGIGYLLIDKNDLDGAADAYRKSLVVDPGSALARSELDYIDNLRKKSR